MELTKDIFIHDIPDYLLCDKCNNPIDECKTIDAKTFCSKCRPFIATENPQLDSFINNILLDQCVKPCSLCGFNSVNMTLRQLIEHFGPRELSGLIVSLGSCPERIIDCDRYKVGKYCAWRGKIIELPKHFKTCEFISITCENVNKETGEICNMKIPKRLFQNHQETCLFSIKTCGKCGKEMIKKDFDNHSIIDSNSFDNLACPEQIINCKCGERVSNKFFPFHIATECVKGEFKCPFNIIRENITVDCCKIFDHAGLIEHLTRYEKNHNLAVKTYKNTDKVTFRIPDSDIGKWLSDANYSFKENADNFYSRTEYKKTVKILGYQLDIVFKMPKYLDSTAKLIIISGIELPQIKCVLTMDKNDFKETILLRGKRNNKDIPLGINEYSLETYYNIKIRCKFSL